MIPGVVLTVCGVSFTRPRHAALLLFGLVLAGVSGSASAATVVIAGNSDPITIPITGTSSAYPSTITVSGITGNVITKAVVVLNDFTHTYPADVDLLLVAPTGERAILMSDAGGSTGVTDIDLTFSSTATTAVPQGTTLTTATVFPANYVHDDDSTDFSDPFPGPAPVVYDREPADLTVFNGVNPNGNWRLYVLDDFQTVDGGDIGGGWTLFLTVPTVFTVTKTADTNDGVCNIEDCSLREAIAAATAASGNDDLIRFSSLFDTPQTITLGGSALEILENMTIQGPGADLLTISGNDASEVFVAAFGSVTLSGLTVRNGFTTSNGGGIYSEAPHLNLRNVAVAGNRAGGAAAGVFMFAGRNQFTGCTFSDNESVDNGSAIMQYAGVSASLKLVNTTISGNRSGGSGALAAVSPHGVEAEIEIVNSTIANNSAQSAGGILLFTQSEGSVANLSLRNTILSNNSAPNIATGTIGGGPITITSLGFNLVDEDTGEYFDQKTDLVGVDPRLGPLTNNGGQTESHALMGGSPALDAGERSGYQRDQRNKPRAFDAPLVDTAAGGDSSDIGALEMQAYMVNFSDDASLRQAIVAANSNAPFHADILFDPGWFSSPRIINLESALPPIATSINIVGPGSKLADVHRWGGGDYRIFEVMDATGREFSISGLTISNGYWPGSGGGIFTLARTSLTEVVLNNNRSGFAEGGGADLGRGTIKNSNFTLNSGFIMGGGLYLRGSMRVINSTFSGNVTGSGGGGGIALHSEFGLSHSLELINSTITGNSAASGGGGGLKVRTEGGGASTATALLRNSIIANNELPNLLADTSGGGASVIDSRGYNLTNDASTTYLDQATDKINTNPMLGPLKDNGGTIHTHALLPNSPAIDAGGRSGYLSDQRRMRRPIDQALIVNAEGGDGSDIGAVEIVPEVVFRNGFE